MCELSMCGCADERIRNKELEIINEKVTNRAFSFIISNSLFLILIFSSSFAQNKFTITGYVKDSLSVETLIGATITIIGRTGGVSSNQYGFYSITLPQGKYTISSSFVGYKSKQEEVDL